MNRMYVFYVYTNIRETFCECRIRLYIPFWDRLFLYSFYQCIAHYRFTPRRPNAGVTLTHLKVCACAYISLYRYALQGFLSSFLFEFKSLINFGEFKKKTT